MPTHINLKSKFRPGNDATQVPVTLQTHNIQEGKNHNESTKRGVESLIKLQRASEQRIKWSLKEENELIKMVEQYGCKWSMIARLNLKGIVRNRNARELKDKAMNLKFLYLN